MSEYDEYDDDCEETEVVPVNDASVSVSGTIGIDTSMVYKMIVSECVKQIVPDIIKEVRGVIVAEVTTQAHQRIEQMFSDALDMEIQETDRWGNPIGARRTVRSVVIDDMVKYLETRIDRNGVETRDKSDQNRAHYIARSVMADTLTHQMVNELNKMKTEMQNNFNARLQEELELAIATLKRSAISQTTKVIQEAMLPAVDVKL